jgi:pyruvate formate lyase activating enzyme
MSERGIIFNIQRFSIHDGPGIRTTVFTKGCSLRCAWCHNPEGIASEPELQYFPHLCIGCGRCAGACPVGAHVMNGPEHVFFRERCIMCDGKEARCVSACASAALVVAGRSITVEEAVTEVMRDAPFYATSGGGVTVSGGEPLLQKDFTRELLSRCCEAGAHTAVETAGFYPWELLADILPVTRLLMMDVKHMDPAKHRKATRADNTLILENVRRAAATDVPLVVRVPVIPGVNDTPGEIAAIRDFVLSLERLRPAGAPLSLELMTFNRLASGKYRSLGADDPYAGLAALSAERMAELTEIARLHRAGGG